MPTCIIWIRITLPGAFRNCSKAWVWAGEGQTGRVARERAPLYIPDLGAKESSLQLSERFTDEGFVGYYGVPLIAKGKLVGVLELFQRSRLSPDDEWVSFLENLAGQAAMAINSITMFRDLERSNLDLVVAYDSTIEGWARALEMRDMETEGHSRRVVELSRRLGFEMGLTGEALNVLQRGALLHDVGKMGVPDSILQKPGPLSEEEWQIMRQHPVFAFKWLSPIAYLKVALEISYCHHEKWDGTGYPRGLAGEEIPISARIFAVVDVWDALNSDRPYRRAWLPEAAAEHIREQSGKQFDPRVVKAFFDGVIKDHGQ